VNLRALRPEAGTPRALVRALCLAAVLSYSACFAQGTANLAEYQIKAAYLYKFLGFIEWPPSAFQPPDAPLTIGVLGAGSLADELTQIVANRQAGGRPVLVRRVQPGQPTTDLHVLFVARAETHRLAAMAAATKDKPLLVVTETDEAATQQGSAINFVVVDDKVRFDVALQAVERASLKVSARLLTVARKVYPGAS